MMLRHAGSRHPAVAGIVGRLIGGWVVERAQ